MNALVVCLLALSGSLLAEGCSQLEYSNVPTYGQEAIIGSNYAVGPTYSGVPCGQEALIGSNYAGCGQEALIGSNYAVGPTYPGVSCGQEALIGSNYAVGPTYSGVSCGQEALIGSNYAVGPTYSGVSCGQEALIGSNNAGCGQEALIGSNCGISPVVDAYPTAACYDSRPAYAAQSYQASPSVVLSGPSYLSGSINCGPAPRPNPIKYLDTVYAPARDEPIRVLPAPPPPAPRVISNKCTCTKVVQKPQLYQRLIVAQKNQRFLKKSYVPRTEKVEYCAKPRC